MTAKEFSAFRFCIRLKFVRKGVAVANWSPGRVSVRFAGASGFEAGPVAEKEYVPLGNAVLKAASVEKVLDE